MSCTLLCVCFFSFERLCQQFTELSVVASVLSLIFLRSSDAIIASGMGRNFKAPERGADCREFIGARGEVLLGTIDQQESTD